MDIQLERQLSLQEALELAYAEDDADITAIYTEPLEISVLSDEDSGAEDDDGDINRLSGRQLRAAVEIQQRNKVRINSDTINQGKYYDIDTQEPLIKEKQTNFIGASGDLQSGAGLVTTVPALEKSHAGKMEVDSVKEVFQQSEEKHTVKYAQYIGDGDSKTSKATLDLDPYNNDPKVTKKERVGHVEKNAWEPGSVMRRKQTRDSGEEVQEH
ncbi:hypothetical protein NQ318_011901 [Aromia moschata]|uniref:Mutator-like transposase domain-containing protein n=1 Tax=Aromia moschata TaxID=1265417 RepID=A0AAV8Y8W5_9CUCU|nr:hypothetical protein NQ318_011901 [Aromia moschata]